MSKLVIVESPAKAKTIGKYLGSDYVVKASMGHLRDLPKKKMSIDIEHDFQPEYVPIEGKDKIIKEIRSEIRKSDFVYLATDPDREGEAISWHIKELFKLKDKNSRRVTFNEITKQAVRSGIENPRDIDIDLVNAQHSRPNRWLSAVAVPVAQGQARSVRRPCAERCNPSGRGP